MTRTIAGITWAAAQNFYYIVPLVLLILGLLMYRYLWQKRTAQLLGRKFLNHFSLTKKACKMILFSLSAFFLMCALARPQWDDAQEKVLQEGRDVLIALDISRSMLAQDNQPNRLDFAKRKIKDLLTSLTAERLSLMVFSGVASIHCPFTADMPAFLSFLNLVDVESISTGTTALDKAISKALDMYSQVPTRKHKIMVIFTDGEDFSQNLQGLQERAKALGLIIFTIGIGTPEGAPIPLYDELGVQQGHQKDEKGNIVISRLREDILKKLSAETGAQYIKATNDDSDSATLVSAVRQYEKEKIEDKIIATKLEKYTLFAGISFLLLLLEWLL